jgi:DNA-directed RNA polymerase beta subunit
LKKSKNRILSEELLVPSGASRVDPYRLIMWASNTGQIVPLKETDIPRIFTGFENQIGERSKGISYITASKSARVIKRIDKHPMGYYDLIIELDETTKKPFTKDGKTTPMNKKTYSVISVRPINKLTENYGYKMNTINNKETGDVIKKDELISSSAEYDQELNMKFGRNAIVAYSPFNNGTFEDAIVVSKSFSEKMTSYKVEKTVALVPSNAILINHESTQRALWKIGEKIDDNLILIARPLNDNLLVSLSNNNAINETRYSDRKTHTNGGKVVDIEIFAKKDQIDNFSSKGGFYKEIMDIYEMNKRYYLSIINTIEELDLYPRELDEKGKPTGNFIDKDKLDFYTEVELDFLYKEAKEWLNEDSIWLTAKSEPINTIALRYTILKESGLETGGKLVGRYGDKGVTSIIIRDDDEMPYFYNHLGEKRKIEVFLNVFGIFNRENPSQLFEQHLSFILNNLADRCRIIEDISERQGYFFNVIQSLDRSYGKFMFDEYKNLNQKERELFWKDVYEYKFPFVMDPFESSIKWDDIVEVQKEFPELSNFYKMEDGRLIVAGDRYIIRLKHDSENKSSVRSTGKNDIAGNLPTDGKKERKIKQVLLSDKSAKFGVMEKLNLEILNDPDIIRKFYAINSLSPESRVELVKEILERGEVFSSNLDIEEFLKDSSNNRKVLDAYLDVLNLRIED